MIKGGRPKTEIKKNKRIYVRLTSEELKTVREKILPQTNFKTVSRFIRFLIFNKSVNVISKDYTRTLFELGKIGSNINQIAKKINTEGKLSENDFKAFTEFKNSFDSLYDNFANNRK